MSEPRVDATVVIPTLGRVQQSIELHRILHDLSPAPRGINFVFQVETEWNEFNNLSPCKEKCSSLISHRSVIAARNYGIAKAKTKYVAFIDDDCRPANENWLSVLLEPLTHRQVALTTGPVFGWENASGNLPFLKRAFLLLPPFLEPVGKVDSKLSGRSDTVAGGNFAARRLELLAARGFSDKFPSPCIYEETELAVRMTSVFDKTIMYNSSAGVIHDQNLSGGMRNENQSATSTFIISQRRILLESVYGKSRVTEARMTAYRAFRLVKSTIKSTFLKKVS